MGLFTGDLFSKQSGERSAVPRVGKGLTIHSEVTGTGDPIILIHGLSGSSRVWSQNVAYLARNFQVHVVDLQGFGRSRGQTFVLSEASHILAQWMDRMGLKKASVVGHSMGGYIAMDLAAMYPDKVERLVLVDAVAGPIDRPIYENAFGLVRALRYSPWSFLPTVLADAYRCGPRMLLDAGLQILEADLTHKLECIQAPTLIVWGRHDTLLPLEMGVKLHFQLPTAQFKVIDRAGHSPMWERPRVFNKVVGDYLIHKPDTRRRRYTAGKMEVKSRTRQ